MDTASSFPRKHRRQEDGKDGRDGRDGKDGKEGPGDTPKRIKVGESNQDAGTAPQITLSIPLGSALFPPPSMMPKAPSTPPYHPLSIVPWVPRPSFPTPSTMRGDIDDNSEGDNNNHNIDDMDLN